MKTSTTARTAKPLAPPKWDLRLYVAGPTPKSIMALRNLECLCACSRRWPT